MNLIIVLLGLGLFGYVACNIGSSKKPGHQPYGIAPALWVIIVCLIGWLLWPAIGPLVTTLLHMFGANV